MSKGRRLLRTRAGCGALGVASTIAWILLGACGMLGAAAGHLTERWGLRAAWLRVMVVCAASLALCALAPAVVATTWLAAAAFGGSYIALTGLLLVWATRLHTESPAAGVGMVFLLLALGQSAGAPVLGMVWDAIGAREAFVVAALLGLLGAWARPTPDRDEKASPRPGREGQALITRA